MKTKKMTGFHSRIQRLKHKARYYRRKILRAIGICDKCGNALNFTPAGRGICPQCGH